jgi:tetratricopeptide (TPR) repeat protein
MSFRLILVVLLGSLAAALPGRAVPLRQDLAAWEEKLSASMHALKSGQAEVAVRLCDEAIAQARHFAPTDTRLARAQTQRGQFYLWYKDYDNALKMFNEAIASCERAVGPQSPELVQPLSSLANYYTYVQPDKDRLIALFTRILGIVEAAHQQSEMVIWSRNLATVYQQAGDFARAEPLFARAVELTEKDQPALVTHQMLTQAQFYRAWKKYDRAEEVAAQALARREKALQAEPSNIDRKLDVSVALDELTAIYLATQRLDQAEATARRSLAIAESFMEPDNADRGPRLELLVDTLRARGKFGEAAELCQRLMTLTEHILGKESEQYANVLTKYAAILHDLKKPEEAAKFETEAAGIRSKLTAAS